MVGLSASLVTVFDMVYAQLRSGMATSVSK